MRRFFLAASPALLLLYWPADIRSSQQGQVELHLKITRASDERGYNLWNVELKRSSGEPVRRTVAGTGDTVRFKSLDSGIYMICLSGNQGRTRCQSVDLLLPPDTRLHRVVQKVETPALPTRQAGRHKIRVSRLAVPGKARKEMLRSEEAQLRGDSESALRHLERAVEIHPDYAEALNNIGTHYHRKGDFEQSVRYFKLAVQSDPDFFAGWVNLGGSLLATATLGGALEANRRAIALRPEDPLANSQIGMNYFYMRDYGSAKKHLEKVLSLDPSSANAPQLFLAQIAWAEKRPAEAAAYVRGYLALHPHTPRAPYLRRMLDAFSGREQPNLINPANVGASPEHER